MFKSVRRFIKNDSGATAIEYGLIAALISIAAIGAMTAMGESLDTMFNNVATTLENTPTGSDTDPVPGT